MDFAVTESALQDLLEASPFNRPYGFRVQSIGDGACTVAVPFQFSHERPDGLISGPVFMAAADVTMWLAIMTKTGIIDHLVTVEMKTNFLNGARAEDVTCSAKVLKLGRRLIYGTAECTSSAGKLLTHHTVTYIRPDA
ncbi:MAG: PaaI family thioesterase [Chloroflexota bacterium]|nr:PaaI family thioesterase [Chloroflexota bacterium]